MQRCPNCGAYVMSDDNICPRCDYPLGGPALAGADVPDSDETVIDLSDRAGAYSAPAPEGVERDESANPSLPDADAQVPDEAEDLGGLQVPDLSTVSTSRLPHARPIFPAGSPALAEDPGPLPEERPLEAESLSPLAEENNAEDADGTYVIPSPEADETILADESGVPAEAEPVEGAPDPTGTQPHLAEPLAAPAEPEVDAAEMPTAQYSPGAPPASADKTIVQPTPNRQTAEPSRPAYIVPPAPFTPPPMSPYAPPPPVRITPPPLPAYAAPVEHGYAQPPAVAYLQQRFAAYTRGGYQVLVHGPHEATLASGKRLSAGEWLLALITIIGFLWYVLIVAVSGFQADKVYIVLESDGRVYEDGPGAAHVRQSRSRAGRRWSAFGLIVFFVCLLLAILLGVVGAVFLTQDRYQAALREAYPAVTLFEENFSRTEADPSDVSLAKDGAAAYAILAGIAVVGLWGGATLFVIGTIHAGAYRTRVPPLPGLA